MANYAEQTDRSVVLKGKDGTVKYKIQLSLLDGGTYCVKVTKHESETSQTVFYKDGIVDPAEATQLFNQCFQDYRALLIVEEADGQNSMEIYADKIDYHLIMPDCCAICKYANKLQDDSSIIFDGVLYNRICHYECQHPALSVPEMLSSTAYDGPTVEGNGICKHFELDLDAMQPNTTVFGQYLSGMTPTGDGILSIILNGLQFNVDSSRTASLSISAINGGNAFSQASASR